MSPALEQFRSSLVYSNTATADDLQRDLAELHALDKQKEREAFRYGCGGFLAVVGAIAGAALLGMQFGPAGAVPTLLLAGAAGVWLMIQGYQAHKLNVEDRRYELARSLVDLLSRDIAPDTPVRVELSLRPADRKENFQREGKVGRWNFRLFHDSWLTLEARLLDGTSCRILLTERRQNRSRRSRSASGKTKFKSKVKSALEAAVRLKPKASRYTGLTDLGASAQGAVQLPAWGEMKGLSVEDGGLLIKAATKTEWDAPREGERGSGPHGVHLVAMMLLSLYQVLNLSRAITKGQQEPGS